MVQAIKVSLPDAEAQKVDRAKTVNDTSTILVAPNTQKLCQNLFIPWVEKCQQVLVS